MNQGSSEHRGDHIYEIINNLIIRYNSEKSSSSLGGDVKGGKKSFPGVYCLLLNKGGAYSDNISINDVFGFDLFRL